MLGVFIWLYSFLRPYSREASSSTSPSLVTPDTAAVLRSLSESPGGCWHLTGILINAALRWTLIAESSCVRLGILLPGNLPGIGPLHYYSLFKACSMLKWDIICFGFQLRHQNCKIKSKQKCGLPKNNKLFYIKKISGGQWINFFLNSRVVVVQALNPTIQEAEVTNLCEL